MIEAVQRKFLKTLYYRKHKTFLEHGYAYQNLLDEFLYQSLHDRRILSEVIFLIKLIQGKISDGYLLEFVNFLVPRVNCRAPKLFYLPTASTRHYAQSPIISMCRRTDQFCAEIDIFTVSLDRIKKYIISRF